MGSGAPFFEPSPAQIPGMDTRAGNGATVGVPRFELGTSRTRTVRGEVATWERLSRKLVELCGVRFSWTDGVNQGAFLRLRAFFSGERISIRPSMVYRSSSFVISCSFRFTRLIHPSWLGACGLGRNPAASNTSSGGTPRACAIARIVFPSAPRSPESIREICAEDNLLFLASSIGRICCLRSSLASHLERRRFAVTSLLYHTQCARLRGKKR
jgi:hypothetical protein